MGLLIAFLTLVSSIAAFYYQKDGKVNQVRGFGVVVLLFVIAVGGLNVYSSYVSQAAAQAAKEEAVRLREENRRAQSALQMQYLDLEDSFTYGQLNFSTTSPDLDSSAPAHPFGKEHLVLFPNSGTPGELGSIWSELPEFMNASVSVRRSAAGAIEVTQEGNGESQRSVSYTLDGECLAGQAAECQAMLEANNQALQYEMLAGIDGDQHLILQLNETREIPALATMSRLMQSAYVGGAVIKSGKDRGSGAAYLEENIAASLYFVQEYKTAPLSGVCKKNCNPSGGYIGGRPIP